MAKQYFKPGNRLYRLPAVANGDHKQIIKWQEDWEACDQLQMNGSIAEHAALHEIGEVGSRLHRRGSDLVKRLEALSGIPTYYYLYRVGGLSVAEERNRPCPGCGVRIVSLRIFLFAAGAG